MQTASIEAQFEALQAPEAVHPLNAVAGFAKNMLISTNC
jgi:hypothetical protein